MAETRKLYLKLLKDFAGNYKSFISNFQKAISEQKMEEARRLAHTLEGVSRKSICKRYIYHLRAVGKSIIYDTATGLRTVVDQLDLALCSVITTVESEHEEPEELLCLEQESTLSEDYEPILLEAAQLVCLRVARRLLRWTNSIKASLKGRTSRRLGSLKCSGSVSQDTELHKLWSDVSVTE